MTTLYLNANVEISPVQWLGGYGIVAVGDILKGEIISVDKLIKGTVEELISRVDPELMQKLYPRNGSFSEKIECNCFKESQESLALGCDMSFYNHSCSHNASRVVLAIKDDLYMVVVSNQDISIGSEVFISYSVTHGHEDVSPIHKFTCGCEMTYEERLLHRNTSFDDAWDVVTSSHFVQNILQNDLERSSGDVTGSSAV